MSDEIELKLALSPQGPARLLEHPLLQGLESRTVSLGNQYYDTPGNLLQARRVALRVRRQGDQRLQTLKSAAESRGGLSSRGEWEWPIDDAERNAAGLDLDGLRALEHPALADLDLETLRPVFTTDFQRRLWRYRIDGSDIEIALDQGTIHAANNSLPICELELELKQGSPAQLCQLAETICTFDDVGALNNVTSLDGVASWDGVASLDGVASWDSVGTLDGVETTELPARPANHSKASRAARLGGGWPMPERIESVTVDTLIDAIANWQDSRDPDWLVSAREQGMRLLQRLDENPDASGWPAWNASARRILADLQAGQVPWRSRDWMLLRRWDA